jgi:hypothetical protein
LEATESASNCPGKTVGKPTTVGDAPVLSFNDGLPFHLQGVMGSPSPSCLRLRKRIGRLRS